jgi:hypothetical protein
MGFLMFRQLLLYRYGSATATGVFNMYYVRVLLGYTEMNGRDSTIWRRLSPNSTTTLTNTNIYGQQPACEQQDGTSLVSNSPSISSPNSLLTRYV